MKKLTVRDIALTCKKVLMRVDFNVPLVESGNIRDDNRIRAAIPKIEYPLQQNCTVILMSHLGKPKGKVDMKFSLQPVAKRLSELINRNVLFAKDCIGAETENLIKTTKTGDVILLENLRFHIEEEKNNPEFAKSLASLGEIYVNDAFATAHRAHASTQGVATNFQTPVAGLLMGKEIEYLSCVIERPKHPLVAIIGGAKIKDKLGVIKNLLPKVDALLIGGGLTFNFLKAQGHSIGNSIFEPDMLEPAKSLLNEKKIILPVDIIVTDKFDLSGKTQCVDANAILDNWQGVDMGKETIQIF